MIKDKLIFNGNEKQVFSTDDPSMVIFRYKDVATAFHGVKRARFAGKGILNNEISGLLLGYLNENGVETHFVRLLGEREQLCRKIEIIPLEVVFHNRISGSLAVKLGVEDGFKPANTILDLVFNNDDLGDPLINRDQAVALGLATYQELDGMYDTVRRAGKLLTDLLHKADVELVDIKFEFGRAV
jgi:Phosphoribosylaminoimidazolesuccinocarboxamide (SAICAR) synthase